MSVNNKHSLKLFVDVLYRIHKDSNWIPPLRSIEYDNINPEGKNPVFKKSEVEYFIAFKDREPVGRISVYTTTHPVIGIDLEKTGFFGHFECINDKEVARQLFNSAENWLKEKNRSDMTGPASFAYDGIWGVQVSGFNEMQVIMIPFNPPYYQKLFEENNFKKKIDFLGWYFSLNSVSEKRVEKAKKIRKFLEKNKNLKIRSANIKEFDREMEIVRKVYNEAWKNNWGTVLLDRYDIGHIAKELKPLLIQDACLIAEIDGNPVAIAIGVPNIYEAIKGFKGKLNPYNFLKLLYRLGKIPFPTRPRLKTGRLLILGVLEKYREGVGTILSSCAMEAGRKLGYREAEGSLTLETNFAINNLIKRLGGIPYKRFRVYTKKIK